MKKPVKLTKEYYDYNGCRDYLQEKYGFNERDYAGKHESTGTMDTPYQDFWHFVLDNTDVSNGSFFTMSDAWKEGAEPWQCTIIDYYLNEFGEGESGFREIELYVWW